MTQDTNSLWLAVGLIPVGFALLIKGADLLVDSASSIAKRFHIPDLIIGLTVVAFGTSAPELVVCVIAAIEGNGGIATGNVIGSNIANICLILGLAGLITPLSMQKSSIWRDIPFLMISTFLLLFVSLTNNLPNLISRAEAAILMLLMIIYMAFLFKTSDKGITEELQKVDITHSISKACIMLFLGFVGLVAGGELIVRNSIIVAKSLGVSNELIGLSVVAIGTSLPELATAIVAVRKMKADIAVGNVIGSNIFNTTLVLGITGTIRPINTGQSLINDLLILTAATLLLVLFMFTGKKNKVDRWESAILAVMYVVYIGYVINRG
jgi:cation:H+ antiporter